MKSASIVLLWLAVALAACAQAPPVAPETPEPPRQPEQPPSPATPTQPEPGPPPPAEPSREIVVVPLEKDGLFGVRATYFVNAPLQVAREVLIDFDRHADFRPGMLKSEILSTNGDSALVRFTIPGLLGINLELTCRNEVIEAADQLRIQFRRESGSSMIHELHGIFDVREDPRDGWLVVVQEFYVAALVVDRDDIPKQHAEDASAIRDRIEAVHRGR